jgi:hypothetical protein
MTGKLYWIATNAMVTKPSGDRVNVGYIVKVPFASVDEFVDALRAEGLMTVERVDPRVMGRQREITTRYRIGLAASAVASVTPYTEPLYG